MFSQNDVADGARGMNEGVMRERAKAKGERGKQGNGESAREKRARKGREEKEESQGKRAETTAVVSKAKTEKTKRGKGKSIGALNFVVEIGKFVLPAVCAWLSRQKKLDEQVETITSLGQQLEEVTLKKVANATEAHKLRREIVELRDALKLADSAADDAQRASNAMMVRKTAGKEVKMKKMAIDHAEQLGRERAECAEAIRNAKALEIGARWREEACRQMKNRALAEAAELEKKVAELEKKIKEIEEAKNKDAPENANVVQNVVQGAQGVMLNALRSVKSIGRRNSVEVAPTDGAAVDPTAPADVAPVEAPVPADVAPVEAPVTADVAPVDLAPAVVQVVAKSVPATPTSPNSKKKKDKKKGGR